MSSAHESGYPNEIQYGNVEDHLIFFTPVHCFPLPRFPSRNENAISPDNPPPIRFGQVSDTSPPVAWNLNAKFYEGEVEYAGPDTENFRTKGK